MKPLVASGVNAIFDAEFLYWYTSVSDLIYATENKIVAPRTTGLPVANIPAPVKEKTFDWSWDPGLRVGFGLKFAHDGWSLYGSWTYFYNSTTESHSVPDLENGFALTNPGTRAFRSKWLEILSAYITDLKTKFSFQMNQFDLQLEREHWISNFLSLKPFFGLRGQVTHTHLNVRGNGVQDSPGFGTFISQQSGRNKMDQWGVGLLAGLNTAWHITSNWSFLGDIGASLTYGRFHTRRKASGLSIVEGQFPSSILREWSTTETQYLLQAIFDLALGVRWEQLFFNDSHRLLIDLAWEMHYWPSFIHFIGSEEFQPAFIPSYFNQSEKENLSLSGIRARLSYEF